MSRAFARLRHHRLAIIGSVLFVVIAGTAVLAGSIGLPEPTAIDLGSTLRPPGPEHALGTDGFGRDVLSRMLFGARTSLLVGLLTVFLAMIIGLPVGLIAGYAEGHVGNVLMRLMDALLAFPGILLALVISATLGAGVDKVILALGIVFSPTIARLLRGQVLSVKHLEYVTAARATGVSVLRLVLRHILPNTLSPLIVLLTFTFARAVVAEASMSFLGVGTQPPNPSWGLDVAENRRFIREASWLVLAPSAFITTTVLSVNFIGDGLRDALDPKHREA